MGDKVMTNKQYRILMELYHEYNEAFQALPLDVRNMFYARLYQGNFVPLK